MAQLQMASSHGGGSSFGMVIYGAGLVGNLWDILAGLPSGKPT